MMQVLLYKYGDGVNLVFKRSYVASWLGVIPELIRKIFKQQGENFEDYSFAILYREIEKNLLDACIKFHAFEHHKYSKFTNQPLYN